MGDRLLNHEHPQTGLVELRRNVLGGQVDRREMNLDECLSIEILDWTAQGLLIGDSSGWMRYGFLSALALLPTAYGGVHFGPLDFIFPTPIEKLLWKISCILFMASGGGAILVFFAIYFIKFAGEDFHKYGRKRNDRDVEIGERSSTIYPNPLISTATFVFAKLDSLPTPFNDVIICYFFCLSPYSFLYTAPLGSMWFWSLSSLCVVFRSEYIRLRAAIS
jgi:hypothetical protein